MIQLIINGGTNMAKEKGFASFTPAAAESFSKEEKKKRPQTGLERYKEKMAKQSETK